MDVLDKMRQSLVQKPDANGGGKCCTKLEVEFLKLSYGRKIAIDTAMLEMRQIYICVMCNIYVCHKKKRDGEI